MRKPIPVGAVVEPYGKVGAVMFTGGERYYFFVDADDGVSMIPACDVEAYDKGDVN